MLLFSTLTIAEARESLLTHTKIKLEQAKSHLSSMLYLLLLSQYCLEHAWTPITNTLPHVSSDMHAEFWQYYMTFCPVLLLSSNLSQRKKENALIQQKG